MKSINHVQVLDGWRGVSILLVLAAHLLPLGPNRNWNLNAEIGVAGMVIFFVLSGFLITSILLKNITISDFLARRFFRVVPLAWLYLAIALAISGASFEPWVAHYLFYANLPPQQLVPVTGHLWSVCVEVQFYLGIAVLVAALGVRGLLALPVLCLVFTGIRIWNGVSVSSITYFRIDEILAGCTLALAMHGRLGDALPRYLKSIPQWPILLLLLLSCLNVGWLPYFRPYLAAALVGSTILNQDTSLVRWLSVRPLIYIAGISYALYVWHPLLAESWLGSGDIFEKYAKRPLFFVALFALAHVSTHYFERRWIAYGKRLAVRLAPAHR
jgi:peptidoglycan/LPS O-acetylase OafA/YrhL